MKIEEKKKENKLSLLFSSLIPLTILVIRQVCGQTLARVRIRTDVDSSIIISLQRRKSM